MTSRLYLTPDQTNSIFDKFRNDGGDIREFDDWFKQKYRRVLLCQPMRGRWFIDFKTEDEAALFKLTHL